MQCMCVCVCTSAGLCKLILIKRLPQFVAMPQIAAGQDHNTLLKRRYRLPSLPFLLLPCRPFFCPHAVMSARQKIVCLTLGYSLPPMLFTAPQRPCQPSQLSKSMQSHAAHRAEKRLNRLQKEKRNESLLKYLWGLTE